MVSDVSLMITHTHTYTYRYTVDTISLPLSLIALTEPYIPPVAATGNTDGALSDAFGAVGSAATGLAEFAGSFMAPEL